MHKQEFVLYYRGMPVWDFKAENIKSANTEVVKRYGYLNETSHGRYVIVPLVASQNVHMQAMTDSTIPYSPELV